MPVQISRSKRRRDAVPVASSSPKKANVRVDPKISDPDTPEPEEDDFDEDFQSSDGLPRIVPAAARSAVEDIAAAAEFTDDFELEEASDEAVDIGAMYSALDNWRRSSNLDRNAARPHQAARGESVDLLQLMDINLGEQLRSRLPIMERSVSQASAATVATDSSSVASLLSSSSVLSLAASLAVAGADAATAMAVTPRSHPSAELPQLDASGGGQVPEGPSRSSDPMSRGPVDALEAVGDGGSATSPPSSVSADPSSLPPKEGAARSARPSSVGRRHSAPALADSSVRAAPPRRSSLRVETAGGSWAEFADVADVAAGDLRGQRTPAASAGSSSSFPVVSPRVAPLGAPYAESVDSEFGESAPVAWQTRPKRNRLADSGPAFPLRFDSQQRPLLPSSSSSASVASLSASAASAVSTPKGSSATPHAASPAPPAGLVSSRSNSSSSATSSQSRFPTIQARPSVGRLDMSVSAGSISSSRSLTPKGSGRGRGAFP